jgi:hypothetical protein
MHDRASEVRRTPLMRGWMHKDTKKAEAALCPGPYADEGLDREQGPDRGAASSWELRPHLLTTRSQPTTWSEGLTSAQSLLPRPQFTTSRTLPAE